MRKQVNFWANFEEGRSYHIYNRSINKEKIFKKDTDCELFLRKCNKLILPYFDIEAYCIMQTHYHLLARVKPLSDEILEKIKWQGTVKSRQFLQKEISYNDFLVDQFKRLFQSYATIYNKEKKRNGSLFQKRFKRILIEDAFRWRYILAYIHHNPIHHKFEKEYENWRFSSYLAFLSDGITIISRVNVLRKFDENLEEAKKIFVDFHENFKIEKTEK